jgi:hypothetical protein
MAENYSLMLVAWLFILLLGGCVLVNAIVDLGARELRRWVSSRRAGQTASDRASKATHIIR